MEDKRNVIRVKLATIEDRFKNIAGVTYVKGHPAFKTDRDAHGAQYKESELKKQLRVLDFILKS